MKNIVLILLITISVKAQKFNNDKQNFEFVNAEASVIIPIGKLANKFDYAQAYGFWFKLGEENGLAANIGFNALFLKNPRPIDYKLNDSVYRISSNKFGFDVGIRVVKIILIDTKNYLELNGTFAIHYLDYDYPENKKDKNKNNNKGFANTTILLAPQLVLMHQNVGLKLQYRFTPYNLIEGMESNFGSNSFALGIVYKQ